MIAICPVCQGKSGELNIGDDCPRCFNTGKIETTSFSAQFRKSTPKDFKPIPLKNEHGQLIEWYFENEDAWAKPIHVDGVLVGTLLISFKTGAVVGVKICIEAIK